MPVLSPHRSSASGLSGSYRSSFNSSALDRPFFGSSSYNPRTSTYSERYISRSYTDSTGRRIFARSGSITEDGVTTSRYREESSRESSLSRDGGVRASPLSDYPSRREASLTRADVADSVAELRSKYSPANYVPACLRRNDNFARSKSINDIGLPPIEAGKSLRRKVNDRVESVRTNGVSHPNNTNTDIANGEDHNGNRESVANLCKKFDGRLAKSSENAAGGKGKTEGGPKKTSNGVAGVKKKDVSTSPKRNRSVVSPSGSVPVNSVSNSIQRRSNDRDGGHYRQRADYSDDDSSGERSTYSYNATVRSPSSPVKILGLNGLKNIGNTCFMNSVIQCLSHTKWLLEYLRNDAYIKDINTSISSMKGALIKAFAEVMKELWSEDAADRVVNTVSLKSQIQRFAPRFIGYSQQDAQEFLRYLLEGLHEDVNRVVEKPKPILQEIDEKLSDNEKASESWSRYLRMDNSRIVDHFVGQLKSTLRCTACGHCSVTFDPFWDLSLPIPQRTGQLRLAQCLDSFTREETLDGEEKPTCSKCKERRKCTKSLSIHKFPKILVIHLKRFSPTERFRGKLNVTVDFPLDGLDMSGYAAAGVTPCRYDLYAISNHSGTTYSGHYTAYCRHPYTNNWHEYNDSRVSSISSKSIVSGEAYVLFYQQEGSKSHL